MILKFSQSECHWADAARLTKGLCIYYVRVCKVGCVESSERTIAGTVILQPVRSEDSAHPTVTPLSEVENAQPLKRI